MVNTLERWVGIYNDEKNGENSDKETWDAFARFTGERNV